MKDKRGDSWRKDDGGRGEDEGRHVLNLTSEFGSWRSRNGFMVFTCLLESSRQTLLSFCESTSRGREVMSACAHGVHPPTAGPRPKGLAGIILRLIRAQWLCIILTLCSAENQSAAAVIWETCCMWRLRDSWLRPLIVWCRCWYSIFYYNMFRIITS